MRAIIPEPAGSSMKRLVLAGGGHAHLSVLQAFAKNRSADTELVLVTPNRYQYYSGMLPGWMARHYREEDCRIDLAVWAERAGARLVLSAVQRLNADARGFETAAGERLSYDLLSLDVGSETDDRTLVALGGRLLPVKPLDNFYARWPEVVQTAGQTPGFALAVVGGGAAGVEIALAARHALSTLGRQTHVHLVAAKGGLLPGHAPGVQRRAAHCLAVAGVQVHEKRGVGTQDGILLDDGNLLPAHAAIAATGARALPWLDDSGLALDTNGFVQVNSQHRSISHATVYAAGDTCARTDLALQRSGVHAVRAGPILAHNLRAAVAGEAPLPYRPRKRSLYLLACGPRYAVASWGGFSAEGAWVWRWKNRLDQGFVRRFSGSMQPL